MTEVSACAVTNTNKSSKVGTVGIPMVKNNIAIVDPETGLELRYGEKGEICISTPTMMKEYLNNEHETSKTIKVTEQKYKTGDPYELGGYKWHVISDDGINLTLLMDANQLGDNSSMKHCTYDTDASTDCGVDSTGKYYVYSWDKSLIGTYLNGEFLTNLESKIGNEIISTLICVDPSRGDNVATYGGYLKSELHALGKENECTNYKSYKVRLISYSEYYNMSPYYTTENSIYPNTENITKISSDSNYKFLVIMPF